MKVHEAVQLPNGARKALASLAKAAAYARDMGVDPWEFALGLPRLVELGACESDLRWLALHQWLEHADEFTTRGDSARRFRSCKNLCFTSRTCFVITEAGMAAVGGGLQPAPEVDSGGSWPTLVRRCFAANDQEDEVAGTSRTSDAVPRAIPFDVARPQWDGERRVLTVGGEVVKQFRLRAFNQEIVLSAFEEEGWPFSIDDPLSPIPDIPPKRRLSQTIKSLNTGQLCPLLRFRGDGSGERVCWVPCPSAAVSASERRRAA